VPRLVYSKTARRDLDEIASFIERESRDRAVAKAFVNKLFRYCEHLAGLPGLLGRPRPELGLGYRSTTFGSYVIFLQYAGKDSRRSRLYIARILHGSRDMNAYFSEDSGDGGMFELNEEEQAAYGVLHP
jgi:toxin ParE1/3/4